MTSIRKHQPSFPIPGIALGLALAIAPITGPAALAQEDPLARLAESYALWQDDVSALRNQPIAAPRDVDAAIERAGAHDADRLSQGRVAYGGLAAASTTRFAETARAAATYYGTESFARGLLADPNYSRTLDGVGEAERRVLEAAVSDGSRAVSVGERYQQAGYDIQLLSWVNVTAQPAAQLTARLKTLAQTRSVAPEYRARLTSNAQASGPSAVGGIAFWDSVRGGEPNQPWLPSVAPRSDRSPAVTTMLTLGALQASGGIHVDPGRVYSLASDPQTLKCVRWSQLMLAQCFAASRYKYDQSFCVGKHALADIAQCVRDVAQ